MRDGINNEIKEEEENKEYRKRKRIKEEERNKEGYDRRPSGRIQERIQ